MMNRFTASKNLRRTDQTSRCLWNFVAVAIVALIACGYRQLENSEGMRVMVSAHAASKIIESSRPFLLYGTAWKKERTAEFVSDAVKSGFRFIDTACQPKHYNEAGVGNGWTAAAQELGLERADFFLQTKYTPINGQDPKNVPYDPDSSIEEQVQQSLKVSLENLHTDYLDSLVLHSPFDSIEDTMKAWRTMESFVDQGKVRGLGISNCYDYDTFTTLYEMAIHKPKVLQNRFYAESNFDTELRKFAKKSGIWYQSFWTLTASREALATPAIEELAKSKNLTPQTLMFAFLMSLGYVTPLSGTTSKEHMAQDVAVMERIQGGEVFFKSDEELRIMAQLLGLPDM